LRVSGESYRKFMNDVEDCVVILSCNLKDFDDASPSDRRQMVLLAMLAMHDCLFPMLERLVGDKNVALSLIRYGGAKYLDLSNVRDDALVARFGSKYGRTMTPPDLKNRPLSSPDGERGDGGQRLEGVPERERVEGLGRIMRILFRAYEGKDTI